AIATAKGQVLQLVPQGQQVTPMAVQLARQLGRGYPLGDAAEDQEDGAGAVMEALQGGAGEGVEHPATVAAPVIEHRLSGAARDVELIVVAVGAGQPSRMNPGEQAVVAGLFIQQVTDGEIHGLGSWMRISEQVSRTVCKGKRKRPHVKRAPPNSRHEPTRL